MAWKLKFSGAQRVDIPAWTGNGRPNWYVIKARFTYNPRTMLLGRNTVAQPFLLCDNGNVIRFDFNSSAHSISVPAGVAIGNTIEIEVEANTTSNLGVFYRVYNANRTLFNQIFVAEATVTFDTIGRFMNGLNYTGEFFWLELQNATDHRRYDANASNGQGAVLIDTISGQNGNLVGFTGAANSWWVFYNSITSTGIPNNTLGAALNQPCAINLNNYFTGATSYSVLSGSLPAGLSISGNQIVGTPTTAQSTQFVIRASNSIDTLDSATITFNISGGQTAAPTQIKLFDGTAFSNRTIKRWNGSAFVDVTLKRWNGSAFVDL